MVMKNIRRNILLPGDGELGGRPQDYLFGKPVVTRTSSVANEVKEILADQSQAGNQGGPPGQADTGQGETYLTKIPNGEKMGVTYTDPTSGLMYEWEVKQLVDPFTGNAVRYYSRNFIGKPPTPPAPILKTIKGITYEFDRATRKLIPVDGVVLQETPETVTYGRVGEADGSIHSITYKKAKDGSLVVNEAGQPVIVRKVQTQAPDPAKLTWQDIGRQRVGLHPVTGEVVTRINIELTPDQIADNQRQADALRLTREQFEYKKVQDAQKAIQDAQNAQIAKNQGFVDLSKAQQDFVAEQATARAGAKKVAEEQTEKEKDFEEYQFAKWLTGNEPMAIPTFEEWRARKRPPVQTPWWYNMPGGPQRAEDIRQRYFNPVVTGPTAQWVETSPGKWENVAIPKADILGREANKLILPGYDSFAAQYYTPEAEARRKLVSAMTSQAIAQSMNNPVEALQTEQRLKTQGLYTQANYEDLEPGENTRLMGEIERIQANYAPRIVAAQAEQATKRKAEEEAAFAEEARKRKEYEARLYPFGTPALLSEKAQQLRRRPFWQRG